MKHLRAQTSVQHCAARLLSLVLFVLFAGHASGQAKKDSLETLWEKKYEMRDYVLTVHRCDNADILQFSLGENGILNIRRLQADGSLRWDSSYASLATTSITNQHASVKEDKKGGFTFVLNTLNNAPFLGKIDANGRLLFAKQFTSAEQKQKLLIQDLFLQDTVVICYGVKNGYFWEGTFTDRAVLKSEELFELGKNTFLTDIVMAPNGKPVVVSKNGVFDKYGGGKSQLLVQRINEKERKLQTVTSFEGKNGRMLPLPNGAYALVYDASEAFPVQKIGYALLDKELKPLVNRPLFENNPGSSLSHLALLDDRTVAVATVKAMRNTLLLLDLGGNVKEELLLDKDKVVSLEHVFYSNGRIGYLCKYFVPSKTTDPAAMVKKKLILFPFKS